MKLEGTFLVIARREQVWEKIRNPALMASCIPGCDSIDVLSPTSYRARVAVGIGPLTANFNLVVDVTEEHPPERVFSITRGEEGTRASIITAQNLLVLSERPDGGTEVAYSSDVSVTGRLGKFGLGVMKKKAQALSQQFVDAFRAKIEAT